jgi:hypothetical protein
MNNTTMMTRLKEQLCEWLGLVEWKRDLPVLFALFSAAMILQSLNGAVNSEYGGHPDEPAHYVTGLMIRDYIATALGKHPMVFAEDYYDHYPKVALGNWPPMFYVMQAAWALPLGTSRDSIIAFMGILTALLAWLIYRALRNEFGQGLAFGAAVLFLLLPLVQEHSASIMTEIPITLFVMLATLAFGRFLDHERPMDAILFGLFAALGILTKGSALSLALAVPLAVAFTRRFHLLTKAAFWLPVPIVLVLAGPWTFKFREQAKAGWEFPQPCWEFTSKALSYYPAKLILSVGATLFVLAMFGLLTRTTVMKRHEPGSGKWAMAAAVLFSVVLAHFVIPCGYEPRHLIPALPALVMFIVAGSEALVPAAAPRMTVGKARTLVDGLALAAFFAGTFKVYQKGTFGLSPAAAMASEKAGEPGRFLISSDATGEGIFIAEVAMLEKRPGSTVRRASKVLASSSWSGAGYQAKFERDEDLIAALEKDGIHVVVTDDSMPANKRVKHHDQLIRALDGAPEKFELRGKLPMERGGVRHEDAIRIYRRKQP